MDTESLQEARETRRYGRLGAKQRAEDTAAGAVLMGVRPTCRPSWGTVIAVGTPCNVLLIFTTWFLTE